MPNDIEECVGTSKPTFKFKVLYGAHRYNYPSSKNDGVYLTPKAKEAWKWAWNNAKHGVTPMGNDLIDWFKLSFEDEKEAAIFKLFWL